MSIRKLPEDVVAQIKSSASITSLNDVVLGLVKNALDASASRINISVDYSRANCIVEDNGTGILPAEFAVDSSLGKPYSTSRFPIHDKVHGRNGMFLAAVSALSLLSVTSHHENYRSHNSIIIHNSKVLARHTPAPPDQTLYSFSHGTRVTVRDLFGSMPVRVKQRAVSIDKTSNRDWDLLKLAIVAVLLPWSGQITVSLRGSANLQNTFFRSTVAIPQQQSDQGGRMISRISSLIYQAGLSEEISPDSWIPLEASADHLAISGAVCLVPVATKRLQFISIGIQPLFNERGSNILYEEINRLFAHSNFGFKGDSNGKGDTKMSQSSPNDPFKPDGFTTRELKARRGVDRWPMFHIRIDSEEWHKGTVSYPVDEVLHECRRSITDIVDVLKLIFHEFLKKHHFHSTQHRRPPDYSKHIPFRSMPQYNQSDSTESTTAPRPTPQSRQQSSARHSHRGLSSAEDLATTRLQLSKLTEGRSKHDSPFDTWTRVKSGHRASVADGKAQVNGQDSTNLLVVSNSHDSDDPLFDASGNIVRPPFTERDSQSNLDRCDMYPASWRHQSGHNSSKWQDETAWTNPVTEKKLVMNSRTGFTANQYKANSGISSKLQIIKHTDASDWAKGILLSWESPVFQTAEPNIPVLFDQVNLSMPRITSDNYQSFALPSVEGRISRQALHKAQILAQVDRKYILVKLPRNPDTIFSNICQDKASLLVMIDQHAADERCQVESLMREYFVADAVGGLRAQTQALDKALRFEISPRECLMFGKYADYFTYWGIGYQTSQSSSDPGPRSNSRSSLKVTNLPPSIAERCQAEPRLLIELLRQEIWELDGNDQVNRRGFLGDHVVRESSIDDNAKFHWLSRFHGCPQGISGMINSRACRSAIMFNDPLSLQECKALVERLIKCAFPYQCAHGRPSMIPLADLGDSQVNHEEAPKNGNFGEQYRRWKMARQKEQE
ncbi:hypothetical protein BX600DRAFT_449357 [Xylariales sp. PMI_506]|nr:hypothetical protein BX600DRAFT_449357 [Xylariales sp. PMI_506]